MGVDCVYLDTIKVILYCVGFEHDRRLTKLSITQLGNCGGYIDSLMIDQIAFNWEAAKSVSKYLSRLYLCITVISSCN